MDPTGQISALESRVAAIQGELDRLPKTDASAALAALHAQLQGVAAQVENARNQRNAMRGTHGVVVDGDTISLDSAIFGGNRIGTDGTGLQLVLVTVNVRGAAETMYVNGTAPSP